MSQQETIIQIMPATGWVAVFDENGDESAEALVCFALVESVQNGTTRRDVRPMLVNGKEISFADAAPNYLRVEELETFEDEGDEEEEDEEDGE
ncbi:hypothetical protein [Dyella sp. C11]|uniref:hypothetical protein n=1 Tax=Dyella sp. C11 TaxID=2126991 RepID=UPI000D6508EA|nr:hypothetical protein [Dyella sp. C11]